MVTEQSQRRFSIDNNSYVVDKAHPNQVKKFKYDDNPKDSDSEIRRCMLGQGIERLLPKLIVGSEASSIRHHLGDMLLATLETSQLNSQDPLLAIQYPFKGKLRSKGGMQDNTLACTRFRRHRVRCFDGAGGGSWRDGNLPASSSLRLCA